MPTTSPCPNKSPDHALGCWAVLPCLTLVTGSGGQAIHAGRFDAIITAFARHRPAPRLQSSRSGRERHTRGHPVEGQEVLFVQTYASRSIAPSTGSPNTIALTLHDGVGQTVYFTNRPERKFGAMATPKFFEAMDFNTVSPNGALVFESAPGQEDVVVLELTAPVYDAAAQAVTSAATVLAEYEGLGNSLQETPQTASGLPSQFGPASLFIDDGCGDHAIRRCAGGVGPDQRYNKVGSLSPDFCWDFGDFCCHPCEGGGGADWSEYCNNNFAACNGQCQAYPWGGCW